MRARCWTGGSVLGLALAGAALWLGLRPQTPSERWDALFAGDELPRLELSLAADARAHLKRHPRKFVEGSLTYEGHTQPAAVRIKGHRSRRDLDEKPAFKLRFDAKQPEGAFLGHRQLTLNNMVEDPSMLREVLAYPLYRALGVSAPRVAHVQVTLDGQPMGLYLLVETLDDDFARSRSKREPEEPAGPLYEGEYGCDLFVDDVDGFDLDAGNDPNRDWLRRFAVQAAGPAHELFDPDTGPLDMPTFLRYLALSNFVGDFDGYRHSHNYFLQFEPKAGKWSFLPWGLDRTFRKRLAPYDSQGWLAKRCFSDAACRLGYVRELRHVADVVEAEQTSARLAKLREVTKELIAADPRQPHSLKRVSLSRIKLEDFVRERPDEVRTLTSCVGPSGAELDADGDGHGCMDCDDADPEVFPGAAEVCDAVDNSCSGLVDDAPECTCTVVESNGRHELCNLPMPWLQARDFCAAKGMVLATVVSKQQSKALYAAAWKLSKQRWWIGYSDRQQEGVFTWHGEAVASFDYWYRGQPDNGSCNQDCVALREGAKGRWHDTHCNQHRPFICGPLRSSQFSTSVVSPER